MSPEDDIPGLLRVSSGKYKMSSPRKRRPQDIGVSRQRAIAGPGSQTLKIESLAAGGRGVARLDGAVWFVEGGLPGDRVLARPIRSKARFHEAVVEKLLEPSPDRRPPVCPYQGTCGGCPWMPLPEPVQQQWKQRLVADALSRIARIVSPPVEPTRGAPQALGYRGRIELSLGLGPDGKPALGYRAAGGAADGPVQVVDVAACAIADPRISAVLPELREILLDPEGPVHESVGTGKRKLRVHLRAGENGVVVALVDDSSKFPEYRLVAKCLSEVSGVAGVVRLIFQGQRRGGLQVQTLAGTDEVVEELAGIKLHLPVAAFTQVHREAADAMTETVLDLAGDLSGRRLWDLYGGVGRYAAAARGRGAAEALVCEADPAAVAAGRQAFPDLVEFVELPTEIFLRARRETPEPDEGDGAASEVQAELTPPDVIVANPPRSGLGKAVVEELLEVGAERLILISCDSATLARDVRGLTESGAYRLEQVVPFDLFPQTAHIEAVSLLVRSGEG